MKIVKIYRNMDRKCNSYGYVCQNVLTNTNLTLAARLVYTLMCTYAQNKDVCFPSIRRMAGDLGCSINTVRDAIKQLEKEEVIISEVSQGAKSLFRLLITPQTVSTTDTVNMNSKNQTVSVSDTTVSTIDPQLYHSVTQTVSVSDTEEYKEEDNKKNIKEEYIYRDFDPVLFDSEPFQKRVNFELKKLDEDEKEKWQKFRDWTEKNHITKIWRFDRPLSPIEFIGLLKNYDISLIVEKVKAIEADRKVLKEKDSARFVLDTWCNNTVNKNFKTA